MYLRKGSSNDSRNRLHWWRRNLAVRVILVALVALSGGAALVTAADAAISPVTTVTAEVSSSGGPAAATPDVSAEPSWPETRPASLARSWVEAFVAGEPAMRRFLADGFAASTLATKSIDERIVSYRSLRERLGTLRLVRIVEERPDAILVGLADAESNEHEFTFELEREEPRKLLSITAALHLGHSLFPH